MMAKSTHPPTHTHTHTHTHTQVYHTPSANKERERFILYVTYNYLQRCRCYLLVRLGEPLSDLLKKLEPVVLESSNSSVSFLCHRGTNSKSFLAVNCDLRGGESYRGVPSARLRGKDGWCRL